MVKNHDLKQTWTLQLSPWPAESDRTIVIHECSTVCLYLLGTVGCIQIEKHTQEFSYYISNQRCENLNPKKML